MSFETTRAAITARFKSAWITASLPVAYENQPAPNIDGPWGRFTVIQGDTDPMQIGGSSTRGTGFIFLQVFLPLNTGTKKATDCADAFAAIFDRASFRSGTTHVACLTTGMADVGERAGWTQKNIRVQFRRDTQS